MNAKTNGEMSANGLTKREAFAMAAVQGLLANSYDGNQNKPLSLASFEETAQMAVQQADYLLAALSQEPQS